MKQFGTIPFLVSLVFFFSRKEATLVSAASAGEAAVVFNISVLLLPE